MALTDIPTHIGPDHTFVCVGHGAIYQRTDADRPSFTVPDNIWVVFWVMHGETLAGKAIEQYRTEIHKVDARYMRGTEPDPDGFAPRADAPKRLGGRLGADTLQGLRQAIATANAGDIGGAATAATAAASGAGFSGATSAMLARGARAQELRRRDRAHDAGLLATMTQELDTGRGIDRPIVEEDRRAPRSVALPEVIPPGQPCPSYRLTYDHVLAADYLQFEGAGGKNKVNAGNLPAFFFADHRLPATASIADRGRRLETVLNFIADHGGPPAIVHWAACRGIFPDR